ncbi:SRPBCC family protein [Dermatobacter hominis]|uniref:SRPBCC family protein n=1 Tax=Dermatobacter hominis TaxID=2884263 RepID=UPI001D0F6790|nr:SRPBCC family protein [Dermatobacter hominis]UDY34586.1 SRPBCC family protein [Dermatobacter hominis]
MTDQHPTPASSTSGPPRRGELVTVDGRPVLRFERRYRQPIERVWRAVTDPDELRRWFPSEVIGDRTPGAPLRFDDQSHREAAIEAGEPTRADGPEFTGRVVAVDPPNVFSFTWGAELLRFELTPDGDGTLMVFTQVLSHPSVAARNGAGWHVCLAELDALLDGGVAEDAVGAEADGFAVYDEYVAAVGPPAGVPSPDGSMTWERGTHVEPDRVRAVVSADLDRWGAGDHADEPLHWEVTGGDGATLIRLTHDGIGTDAARAATWHALLLQLDMYLAAGELMPADPAEFVPMYRHVLGD